MSSLKNKFDSIIFDLDGTLWDSSRNVTAAWQMAMDEVGLKETMTQEKVRSITGLAYDVIFDKLFYYVDPAARKQLMEVAAKIELDVLYTKGGDLYPGLNGTLAYLAGSYKLYIVSNCQSGYIEVFLKLSSMADHFSGHQCYGTKGNPKSENIKDIVNDHHLKAPVYIGDTLGDYDAATKAGVPFIFANYGFGEVHEGQIATISAFGDLRELL